MRAHLFKTPGAGVKICTKIAYPVLERLRKEDGSSSSKEHILFFRSLKRNRMTTERAEDLVLVHNNWRLKHLKLDEASDA